MVTSSELPRVAVVVGSGSATVREVLRHAAGLAQPVLVFDGADDGELAALRTMLQEDVECLEYRPEEPAELLETLRTAPVHALTTFAEDKIRTASEIAALLHVPYHSRECALDLTDKAAQRAALARAGLGIDFGMARDVTEAATIVQSLGVACVVKPLTGSGSKHTFAVDPTDNVADVLRRLGMPFPAIVEARLESGQHPRSERLADVVSVETVFCGGVPVHLGICGRFSLAPPFRETGMVFPSQLPDALVGAAYDVAERALAALGVRHGATHTELKLTPSGFQVIEVNGRLGGDVGRLLELSTGTHAVELVLRAVCSLPVVPPPARAVAAVSMLVAPLEATRLASRVPAASLRAVDGVVAIDVHGREGDAVDYRTGWWAHVACIWFQADRWEQLSSSHAAALTVADKELAWT